MNYIWVFLGSAVGGVLRYWCNGWVPRVAGVEFPWATLLVNVVGCSFIGWFATITGPEGRMLTGSSARVFVMTGMCGGFTTFSTFSLETLNLARGGEFAKAAANAAGSLALCLVGVWAGYLLAVKMSER